jgi:hypothetical protein
MKGFGSIWARGIPPFGRAEAESRSGRAFDARPSSHAAFDSAQVCGVGSGGIDQGQERDPSGPDLGRAQAKSRRAAFLRGYIVSTVGRGGTAIGQLIRNQEVED